MPEQVAAERPPLPFAVPFGPLSAERAELLPPGEDVTLEVGAGDRLTALNGYSGMCRNEAQDEQLPKLMVDVPPPSRGEARLQRVHDEVKDPNVWYGATGRCFLTFRASCLGGQVLMWADAETAAAANPGEAHDV